MKRVAASMSLIGLLSTASCTSPSDTGTDNTVGEAGGTTAASGGSAASGAGATTGVGGAGGSGIGGTAGTTGVGGTATAGSSGTGAAGGVGGAGGTGGSAPTCSEEPIEGMPNLGVQEIVGGLTEPIDFQVVPNDPRLFVVERPGQIRVVKDGSLLSTPFLDIRDLVESEGLDSTHEERGLLGLAFAPDYASSGRFYVAYNRDGAGDHANTRISEFTVSANPDVADSASEKLILEVVKPSLYHNGGQIRFGPDGYLYFGTGDGRQEPGGDYDNQNNGQRLDVRLGKMLRIQPTPGGGFTSPSDNPFVGKDGLDEIWAYGLRNPFRFSFDRETGDMYIGDVGRRGAEEINFQPASSTGGENYGWSVCEGNGAFQGRNCGGNVVPPMLVYAEGGSYGRAVVGGFVYRGCRMPALHGTYFFADFFTSTLYSTTGSSGAFDDVTDDVLGGSSFGNTVSAFGEDNEGELYLLDWDNGKVFKLVPQ